MGEINLLAVFMGALAFFAVGALWYTVLFGKAWMRAVGMSEEQLKTGANMGLIFGLTFLLELLIATAVWHSVARGASSDRGVMMMAIGFGATIMVPAVGINYLYLRKTLTHFLIDAGHIIAGMAAMGGVFTLVN